MNRHDHNCQTCWSAPTKSKTFVVRTAMTAALVAAGVVFGVSTLLDPLGLQRKRADESARQAVGLMLCVSTDVYRERIAQITATRARGETLTRNERDVLLALSEGLGKLNRAADILAINCEE